MGALRPLQVADKALVIWPGLCCYWWILKYPGPTRYELEMVTLEELVPSDHLPAFLERKKPCSR